MEYRNFGKTGLQIPKIVFGTSALGNLYEALPVKTKYEIVSEMFRNLDGQVVLDSAGKYGAGLALEVMGESFRHLMVDPERVLISNKLGWLRTELKTPEPTFEPGAWVDLKYDAVQKISYDGIMECWEQGCKILGMEYPPALVSVHDPDEYIARGTTNLEKRKLISDVVLAYRALHELKDKGLVKGVGIGAKDWKVIRMIDRFVDLDWVMFANSYTILRHPAELYAFFSELNERKVGIINSAVFHAGFLTGGRFFDYVTIQPDSDENRALFRWRDQFVETCRQFDILPAAACVQFGLSAPGVCAVSLNTTNPVRVRQNIELVQTAVPVEFWNELKKKGLISNTISFNQV